MVQFADPPEPLMIKVKYESKRDKPLIITTKSLKSVNTTSSKKQSSMTSHVAQESPFEDPLIPSEEHIQVVSSVNEITVP